MWWKEQIHATPSIQNSTRISPQAVQMADFMVLQIKVKWTKSIKFKVKRLKNQRATGREEYLSLQTRGIANLEYLQDKERWQQMLVTAFLPSLGAKLRTRGESFVTA